MHWKKGSPVFSKKGSRKVSLKNVHVEHRNALENPVKVASTPFAALGGQRHSNPHGRHGIRSVVCDIVRLAPFCSVGRRTS